MMDSKTLVKRVLSRQPVDRIPIYDSFWQETASDFRRQGVPDEMSLEDYFELDIGMMWFEQSFLLPETIIDERPDKRVYVDGWGTVNQVLVGKQTTPGLLSFAVKSSGDWERKYKSKLIYSPTRIDWQSISDIYLRLRGKSKYIVLSMLDPFECAWHMVGPENQLMMMVNEPDWLLDMYESSTRLIEDAWRDLEEKDICPDGLWLYGDIAYQKGMLFSPKHYESLLMPFHARLADLAHQSGADLIYHSDGNLKAAIPYLIEAGADCLHPLEVKAGMDIQVLKAKYGDKISFMGNIDARLFQTNDLAGLEAEIKSKLPSAMEGGGYIYHSDHSIPPGTNLETYKFALRLIRELGRYSP